MDAFIGVCDELTNHARCIFDGGDCCKNVHEKNTDHCNVCTCRKTVNVETLKETYETGEIKRFKHVEHYSNLSVENFKHFQEVESVDVCSLLCLEFDDEALVNSWMFFKKSRSCRCQWVKSPVFIDGSKFEKETYAKQSVWDPDETAFVQTSKLVPPGKSCKSCCNFLALVGSYTFFHRMLA